MLNFHISKHPGKFYTQRMQKSIINRENNVKQCRCCELKTSTTLPARNFKNVAPTSVLGFTVQLNHAVKRWKASNSYSNWLERHRRPLKVDSQIWQFRLPAYCIGHKYILSSEETQPSIKHTLGVPEVLPPPKKKNKEKRKRTESF